jgi:hypothetical protein
MHSNFVKLWFKRRLNVIKTAIFLNHGNIACNTLTNQEVGLSSSLNNSI